MNQGIKIKQFVKIALVLGCFFVLSGCLKKDEVKPVVVEKKQGVKKDEKVVEKVEEVKKDEIDTSDWLTYRNEELGFEVKYPKEWPEVKIQKSDTITMPFFEDASNPIWNLKKWSLDMGNFYQAGPAVDNGVYYDLSLYGFKPVNINDYNILVNKIKKDSSILIVKEETIDKINTVTYKESGICGYLARVLIYNNQTNQFVWFFSRCDVDSNNLLDQTMTILSTFKFINKNKF
jgi:hypothetical protein